MPLVIKSKKKARGYKMSDSAFRKRFPHVKFNPQRMGRLITEGSVPNALFVKPTYHDAQTLTSTTGSFVQGVYALNSLYDPWNTGTGLSIPGWTQLSALYRAYRVYACKMIVRFTNRSATSAKVAVDFGVDSTIQSSFASIANAGANYAVRVIGPLTGNNITKITRYIPIHKIFGISKQRLRDDDQYQAATNANPSQLCYGSVMLQAEDQTSTVIVGIEVDLKFYTKIFSRKEFT